jgi:septum formation protein
MDVILGSQSPRRRELMAGLDIPFIAITIDADESYPSDLREGDIPRFISRAKAQAYLPKLQANQLLITADTIVWLDGQMLGKPHDEEEAVAMLHRLSGRTHQVYTAVTLAQQGSELETLVDRTDVTFATLTDEEIRHYVSKYKPLDKAGSYGVQEWIGYVACTEMKGSYFNVMGFPTHLVYPAIMRRIR